LYASTQSEPEKPRAVWWYQLQCEYTPVSPVPGTADGCSPPVTVRNCAELVWRRTPIQ
jgi:hypothetical protein